MMQSPLLGYTAFSHFLHMTSPPGTCAPGRAAPAAAPAAGPGMSQFLASSLLQHLQHPQQLTALCPSPSPGSSTSPSPSCSPPTSLGSSLGSSLGIAAGPKSFTIDAILGLSGQQAAAVQLRVPRFHLADSSSSPTDLTTSRPAQPHSRMASGSEGGAVHTTKKGGGGGGKCKRVRTIFTADQLERLEAEFERQQYMVGPERLYLAHALSLTEAQVKVWFQNRRIKWRKQHLELEQQRLAAIKQHQLHEHEHEHQLEHQLHLKHQLENQHEHQLEHQLHLKHQHEHQLEHQLHLKHQLENQHEHQLKHQLEHEHQQLQLKHQLEHQHEHQIEQQLHLKHQLEHHRLDDEDAEPREDSLSSSGDSLAENKNYFASSYEGSAGIAPTDHPPSGANTGSE